MRDGSALTSSAGGDQLAIDDLQRVGIVAALKIERLVIRAVDMNYLAGIQADPNASRRAATFIRAVPNHDVGRPF